MLAEDPETDSDAIVEPDAMPVEVPDTDPDIIAEPDPMLLEDR
jgi:hypothetical protein